MLDPAIAITRQFHKKVGDRVRSETSSLEDRKIISKKVLYAIDQLSTILKHGKKSGWDVADNHKQAWFIYSSLSVSEEAIGNFEVILEIKRNQNALVAYTINVEGAKGFAERKRKFNETFKLKGGRQSLSYLK